MPTPYALSSDLVSAWPAKSLAVAQYVDGYKLDTGPVQNAQTGTSYTFALADTTKTVTASNAAASTYTVPPQSSVVWEDYTTLRILNLGAGVVTLTAGAGVTLNGTATVAQYSSATLVRTASNTWTIAGSGTAPGMVLITPTSVAGSGVSFSGGLVSFTAATEVDVNGCFTSAYDNYQVIWDIRSSSASDQLNVRLRASGTNSATNYYCSLTYAAFNANSVAANGAALGNTIMWGGYTQSVGNAAVMNIERPAIAAATIWHLQGGTYTAAGYAAVSGGYHTTASAYDGLALIPAAGNITGNVRVYGMRNQ